MSYVGRSDAERRAMLERIGARSMEELWSAIPERFRLNGPLPLPPPLAEYELTRRFQAWAEQNATPGSTPASSARASTTTSFRPPCAP